MVEEQSVESIEALVRRARASDASLAERHAAFSALVARFQDVALSYAFAFLGDRGLAEDAAQEAFLAAYRQLDELRDPPTFPGWLRHIIRTQCHRLTRRKRHPTTPLATLDDSPSPSLSPTSTIELIELQRALRVALQSLPDGERIVILLYYLGHYPQAEIATFLGVPVTTVKKRLQYARQHLQDQVRSGLLDDVRESRPSSDPRFVRRIRLLLFGDALAAEGQRGVEDLLKLDGLGPRQTRADLHLLRFEVAQAGYRALLELLLVDGMDVDDLDADGLSPLAWAVEYGDGEALGLLLRRRSGDSEPTRNSVTEPKTRRSRDGPRHSG